MATRNRRVKRIKKQKRRKSLKNKLCRGGGYGKASCPFVGPSWNGLGPPSNYYAKKPWYTSNHFKLLCTFKIRCASGWCSTISW